MKFVQKQRIQNTVFMLPAFATCMYRLLRRTLQRSEQQWNNV